MGEKRKRKKKLNVHRYSYPRDPKDDFLKSEENKIQKLLEIFLIGVT
jgi:hypothetical protein